MASQRRHYFDVTEDTLESEHIFQRKFSTSVAIWSAVICGVFGDDSSVIVTEALMMKN